MADRQDIDALLIGALYGELDGDERTRLDAHLTSHPQDRSALEGLRSTRELLREADLRVSLAVAEPSPAITAKLLQEAARRAPVKATGGGILAFLASLLRPFAASPALSAAAALVLVGGAAGLMYSNGTFNTSEPTVGRPDVAHAQVETQLAREGKLAPGAPTPNVDDYRVALDDGERDNHGDLSGLDTLEGDKRREAQLQDEANGTTVNPFPGNDRVDRGLVAGESSRSGGGKRNAEETEAEALGAARFQTATGSGSAATFGDTAVGAKLETERPGYIELSKQTKDQPTVLALDGTNFERKSDTKNIAVDPADSDDRIADNRKPPSGGSTSGAVRGAGGSGAADKKAPERIALAEGRATEPAAAPPSPPAVQKPGVAPQKDAAPKTIAGKPQTQQVARDQGKARGSAYDPVKAAALDTWARDQHARMVKLVNAGKCTDAGTVGAEIARKAPDYYQANVANDRAVRACRSYVDRARRAKASGEAKTKAAAPRSPQPDSPYQSDSMESVK